MKGSTVKAIRISKGLTQAEFAEILGVVESSISRIESGQRGVSDRIRIRIAQLFGGDPEVEQAIQRARAFEKLSL